MDNMSVLYFSLSEASFKPEGSETVRRGLFHINGTGDGNVLSSGLVFFGCRAYQLQYPCLCGGAAYFDCNSQYSEYKRQDGF